MTYSNLERIRLTYKIPFELPKSVTSNLLHTLLSLHLIYSHLYPVPFLYFSIHSFTSTLYYPPPPLPKYDFDLERRITKEELKYKQQEEMQKMVQAQQQLFVMEYLFEKNKKAKNRANEPHLSHQDTKAKNSPYSNISQSNYNTPSSSKAPIIPPFSFSPKQNPPNFSHSAET
ncbi:hypothetical protein AYI69_g5860, partial [Smittium culicis]